MILLLLLSSFFALSSQNEELTHQVNNSIYYFTHWGWNLASLIVSSLVVIIALFGDYFKKVFFPVKLTIIEDKIEGHFTKFNNNKSVYFFNATVKNKSKTTKAENVRVLLKKISIKQPNGDFKEYIIRADTSFKWAPQEERPEFIDISTDNKFDVGYIEEEHKCFMPSINRYFHNIEFKITKNQVVRYEMQIKADNIFNEQFFYFEISFNGNYSTDSKEMESNLIIKKVRSLTSKEN